MMLPSQSASDQMAQSLSLIRQRFLEGLPQKIDLLDTLVTRIELRHMLDDALSQIEREMHKIAGVAKTLGFPDLGDMARSTETDIISARAHGLSDANLAELTSKTDATVDLISQILDAENA